MAGGKSKRLALNDEKLLIEILGKTMIERVLDALANSKEIGEIYVAVSDYTPKTEERLRKMSLKVVKTSGEGFIDDVQFVVREYKLGKVLVINADLPLITSEIIDQIVNAYQSSDYPALTVMVPIEVYKRLGLESTLIMNIEGKELVPAGINIIDGKLIDKEQEQKVLIIDKEEVAVNVNKLKDLKIAEKIAKEIGDN